MIFSSPDIYYLEHFTIIWIYLYFTVQRRRNSAAAHRICEWQIISSFN